MAAKHITHQHLSREITRGERQDVNLRANVSFTKETRLRYSCSPASPLGASRKKEAVQHTAPKRSGLPKQSPRGTIHQPDI